MFLFSVFLLIEVVVDSTYGGNLSNSIATKLFLHTHTHRETPSIETGPPSQANKSTIANNVSVTKQLIVSWWLNVYGFAFAGNITCGRKQTTNVFHVKAFIKFLKS